MIQAVVAGMAALAALAILFSSGNAANQGGREMDLKTNGQAWELNADANGHLWISDYKAGEIWQLNPASDVYTTYTGLDGASDGRLDASGDLWWASYDDYAFGRLDLDNNLSTIWPLTGTVPGQVTGLNFDDQGRVWMPNLTWPDLYRFDPQSEELCHYELPNQSISNYIASHDGYLWLADWKLPYVYRIDPLDGSYVQWFYGRDSDPWGMTFDDDGNLWWAGLVGVYDEPSLVRFSPSTTFVTFFELPVAAGEPVMVDARHGLIWYSDSTGYFGRLDPSKASGATRPSTGTTGSLELVQCYQDWQPSSETSISKSTASANWPASLYPVTNSADGWLVYQLPQDSEALGPWGIKAREDGVWVVDQERQKLVHMPWQKLFVPLVTN